MSHCIYTLPLAFLLDCLLGDRATPCLAQHGLHPGGVIARADQVGHGVGRIEHRQALKGIIIATLQSGRPAAPTQLLVERPRLVALSRQTRITGLQIQGPQRRSVTARVRHITMVHARKSIHHLGQGQLCRGRGLETIGRGL